MDEGFSFFAFFLLPRNFVLNRVTVGGHNSLTTLTGTVEKPVNFFSVILFEVGIYTIYTSILTHVTSLFFGNELYHVKL